MLFAAGELSASRRMGARSDSDADPFLPIAEFGILKQFRNPQSTIDRTAVIGKLGKGNMYHVGNLVNLVKMHGIDRRYAMITYGAFATNGWKRMFFASAQS